MSFAERDNKQSITEVVLKNGNVTFEKILFDTPVKLITLPKKPQPIEEVIPMLQSLPDGEISNTSPFLEIKVLVKAVDPTMRTQIEDAITGKAVRLARIEAVSEKIEGEKQVVTYEDFKKTPPNELIEDLYINLYSKEMPEAAKNILNEIIEEATK